MNNTTTTIINNDQIYQFHDYRHAEIMLRNIYDMPKETESALPYEWRKLLEVLDSDGTLDPVIKGLPFPIDGDPEMTVSVGARNAESLCGEHDPNTRTLSFVYDKICGYTKMNESYTTAGGYRASYGRTHVMCNELIRLPKWILPRLALVNKTSFDTTANSEIVTQEKLYMLSHREVYGDEDAEKFGAIYSDLFDCKNASDSSIRKDNSGTVFGWWLRSASSFHYFRYVSGNGGEGNNGANFSYGVVLGFCVADNN